jgi:limonene-1,2-epoxide hydrolase
MFDTAMSAAMMAALEDDEEKNKEKRVKTMDEIYVSPILKSLIGKECIISHEQLDDERGIIKDVDAEFFVVTVHGKKGDVTLVERIDGIEEIQLV